MNRYRDWFEQAKRDLDAAKSSRENHHYEWACFQAQQSGEKAIKALLLVLKVDAWGHGLVHLLSRLSKAIEIRKELKNNILEICQELDRQYIQPRYPNGFATGYPSEYYNDKDAEVNINNAEFILRFVEEKIKSLSSSE